MICERDIAVGAVYGFAARATEYEARIASTVQKDYGLLAALVSLFDCCQEFFGENFWTTLSCEDFAHVNHLCARHRAVCDSRWKMKITVLSASRVVKRFERGCCRTKHDDRTFTIGADNAHVAPVVVRRLLLAIRGFVLFV